MESIKTSIGNIEIPVEDLGVKRDKALEVIFDYGNQEAAGKPNQLDLVRSLSMGDTVEYEGKTWLIMPFGWQDVSQLSQEGIDKLVGKAKIDMSVKSDPKRQIESIETRIENQDFFCPECDGNDFDVKKYNDGRCDRTEICCVDCGWDNSEL